MTTAQLTDELLKTPNNVLAKKPKRALVAMARANSVPADGTRVEILDRLVAIKAGGGAGYVNGQTLCRFCGHICKVVKTVRKTFRSAVVTRRRLKCDGPRHHRYWDRTAKER